MPRKTNDVRRKGKDKAREHFEKCGKYDGKSVRRVEAYFEKASNIKYIEHRKSIVIVFFQTKRGT